MATATAWKTTFVGRKVVQGPLNDIGLSLVVTDLRGGSVNGGNSNGNGGNGNRKGDDSVRCSVEFGDKSLSITYIKRDEGFESDGGESTNSSEAAARNGGTEEKIIKDHVFKPGGVVARRQVNSGGSDGSSSSGDEIAADHPKSEGSSKSSSPTSDLGLIKQYRFDHKESYSINDVLICHTDRSCVVWVIRNPSRAPQLGQLEALVMDCAGEADVAEIYRKFLEVSKRSKLERHRRRKSDGGSSAVARSSVDAIFNGGKSGNGGGRSEKTKSVHVEEPAVVMHDRVQGSRQQHPQQNWNLIQHTDRNGITHIEVESQSTKQPMSSLSMANTTAAAAAKATSTPFMSLSNVPTSAAAANDKSSSSSSSSHMGILVRPSVTASKTDKSKFARELENILTKELETRKERVGGVGENPGAGRLPSHHQPKDSTSMFIPPSEGSKNLLLGDSPPPPAPSGAIPRLRATPGESLSLRQRAPALLLKKLDEFEERAQRVWAKHEQQQRQQRELMQQREAEDAASRKVWQHGSKASKMASRTPPPMKRYHHEQWRNQNRMRQRHLQQSPKSREGSPNSSPTTTTTAAMVHNSSSGGSNVSTPVVQKKKELQTASVSQPPATNNEKQILIPTKTGKEPVKKLYPKEPNPDMMRMPPGAAAPRFVPLPAGVPITTIPAAMASSIQYSAQPHSLPMFPAVQITAAPVAWARYPAGPPQPGDAAAAADPNNNLHLMQAQWAAQSAVNAVSVQHAVAAAAAAAHHHQQQQQHQPGRGRSRDRGRMDPEHRRRAQSKSPARSKQSSSNGSNAVSDFFREFKQKMTRKSNSANFADSVDGGPLSAPPPSHPSGPLKSNLKKNLSSEGAATESGESDGATNEASASSVASAAASSATAANDNRKVHFNKFATVQMME